MVHKFRADNIVESGINIKLCGKEFRVYKVCHANEAGTMIDVHVTEKKTK